MSHPLSCLTHDYRGTPRRVGSSLRAARSAPTCPIDDVGPTALSRKDISRTHQIFLQRRFAIRQHQEWACDLVVVPTLILYRDA